MDIVKDMKNGPRGKPCSGVGQAGAPGELLGYHWLQVALGYNPTTGRIQIDIMSGSINRNGHCCCGYSR